MSPITIDDIPHIGIPYDDPDAPPRRGEVKIAHEDVTIRVSLGDGAPEITDGFGGWVEVPRPQDEPITRWESQPALRMDLPLLVDTFGTGLGAERDLDRLLRLGRKKDGRKPPPVFRVTGAVPFSGAKWVMEDTPEMGEAIYQRGQLVRQFLTLHLLSYEDEDTAKFKKRDGNDGPGGNGGGNDRYRVKEGDTLRKIAAKLKPDASNERQRDYANEIGKLNDIKDVRRELNPGRILRLP
jgi:hypothetical protein